MIMRSFTPEFGLEYEAIMGGTFTVCLDPNGR